MKLNERYPVTDADLPRNQGLLQRFTSALKSLAEDHVRFWVTMTDCPLKEAQALPWSLLPSDSFTPCRGGVDALSRLPCGNTQVLSCAVRGVERHIRTILS